MRRIVGPAGTIIVEEHGQGPLPILLVHGMAGDASFWASTARAMGTGCRLIIPELRGHGRSAPSAAGDYSIEGCADDLEAVLDELELGRVVMVGHSFGGSVAMELSARLPDRVAGLLLLDAAGDFSYVPPEALGGFMAGLAHDAHYAETVEGAFEVALDGATPETERRVRAAILAAPRAAIRAMYDSLLRYKPTRALDRYPGPTLLVTAPVNSASFALHALRPRIPRRAMSEVSHWLMMDQPGEVARIVREFLELLVHRDGTHHKGEE
jgi:pimeloyl-ACP methyl ester carboxylesterase